MQPHAVQIHAVQPHAVQPHAVQPHAVQPMQCSPMQCDPCICGVVSFEQLCPAYLFHVISISHGILANFWLMHVDLLIFKYNHTQFCFLAGILTNYYMMKHAVRLTYMETKLLKHFSLYLVFICSRDSKIVLYSITEHTQSKLLKFLLMCNYWRYLWEWVYIKDRIE